MEFIGQNAVNVQNAIHPTVFIIVMEQAEPGEGGMKRSFVSHCIFPHLGTVFLPSRKTGVDLELCWGKGSRRGGGPTLGPCPTFQGLGVIGAWGFIKLRPSEKAAQFPAFTAPPELQNQAKLDLWNCVLSEDWLLMLMFVLGFLSSFSV